MINNNVVSAYNDNGKEIVVVGKGIGFQKKIGDSVKQELVEKVFLLNDFIRTIYHHFEYNPVLPII